jgi:putative ABC transport system permease protein
MPRQSRLSARFSARLLDTFSQDLRYAARSLRHAPGFTIAAVVTLALGIGSTTAVFTLINAVLLRPLPYTDPERIVEVHQVDPQHDEILMGFQFDFLRDKCGSCEQLAARKWSRNGLNIGLGTHGEYVDSAAVSAGYFEVFGVQPLLGRRFTREDEHGGAANGPAGVALISHGLWQRLFQGDPQVVGRTVLLGGTTQTIVGVLPAAYRSMPPTDVFTPLPVSRMDTDYITVARLKPGVTLSQAQTEFDALSLGARESRDLSKDARFFANRYQAAFTADARQVLLMLMIAVGLLLLIACANTAGLLIVRAAARRREIATRVALGAGRLRIIGQLLTESVLLALLGGLLGMLATRWTVSALIALLPAQVTLWQDFSLDRGVLALALLLSAGTGVIFGLLPALDATRVDLREVLHAAGSRSSSGGRSVARLRHGLIIVQVALSVLLLVGAGLLMRSVVNLLSVPTGIDIEHVMTAQMSMQRAGTTVGGTTDTFDYAGFYQQTLARIQQVPEVEAAAVVNDLPLMRGLRSGFRFLDLPSRAEPFNPDWRYITPDYFRVFRVPVLAGRGILDADTASAAPVALVNEALVRRYLSANGGGALTAADIANALGHQLVAYRPPSVKEPEVPRMIVGVVADVRSQPSEPVRPTIYLPVTQVPPRMFGMAHRYFPVNWVVRTRGANQANLTAALRDAVHAVDPQQPFSGFKTMTQVRAGSVEDTRSQMLLLGAFAIIALALAAAGIYGLIAYTVVQRTRELGIRLALGATPGRILSRIMLHGIALAAIGAVVGIGAALLATRWLKPFVFGISAVDPMTFGVTALFLLIVAALASAVPAIRAARIDPMSMVRSD